jgi:hypothetical protein
MSDHIEKPRALKIISWLWIGIGTLMALAGLRSFWSNVASAAAANEMGLPMWDNEMFISIQALAALIAVVGIAGVVGGANLLSLRSWARTLLEAANWGTVLIIAAFAHAWESLAVRAASRAHLWGDEPSLLSLSWEQAQPIVVGLAVYAAIAVPFAFMARKLRDPAIYDAIGRAFTRRFDAAAETP